MYISLFFFLINTFFASNRRSIYLCFFLISSLGVYYKLFETRKLPLFFFKVIQSKRYFFFLFPFFSLSFLSLFHIFFNKFFQLDSLLLFVNNKVISRSFFFFVRSNVNSAILWNQSRRGWKGRRNVQTHVVSWEAHSRFTSFNLDGSPCIHH